MCISRATKDLRQVQSFIAESEGNLARGYALVEQQYVDYDIRRCGTTDEGKAIYCREPDIETRRVPKAIDLDAEAAKLAALKKKEAQLSVQAQAPWTPARSSILNKVQCVGARTGSTRVRPPSTVRICPVMKPEQSDVRYCTVSATSEAGATRPEGVLDTISPR